jgi:hypothetical protein
MDFEVTFDVDLGENYSIWVAYYIQDFFLCWTKKRYTCMS